MSDAQLAGDTALPGVIPSRSAVSSSPTRRMLRRFLSSRLAVLGAVILTLLVVCAVLATVLSPYNPIAVNLTRINHAPDAQNWLGTDGAGRDVLSRILYGARVSLSVGIFAVALYVTIGLLLGAVAGYFGGRVDDALMRFTEVIMCFPTFALMLILVSMLGASVLNIILVIGIFGWTGIARIVRGQVLQLRELDYVLAARSVGCKERTVIFRHILPNLVGPLTVAATMGIGGAILSEAGLSFLGLGILRPTPSWGSMLSEARAPAVLVSQAWLWLSPGVAISLAVLAVNFMGDGLRDAFDVRGSLRG